MSEGFEWTERPSNLAVIAIPGKPLEEVRKWSNFLADWEVVKPKDLSDISVGYKLPPSGNEPVVLQQRPGGTLIWEPYRPELSISVEPLAREHRTFMASVVGNEGIGAAFSISDADGTIAGASNVLQDEVFGSDPHRYDAQFELFGVVPGMLVFMRCVKLAEYATGMDILPPQECPDEPLIFGSLRPRT